ncbi:hypothetical protein [Paenibacillus flagellatus]|uniref:Uncharacterized protein n=1 Tax=Paenibacillus flagellatus TaxID=2211139 RepID=A0A2V5K8L7_9BACL|nr:hypothetical protein [Paenibacillus flagellatus]PYI55865.1 hypothetical protein DLM86_09125 [Paenibacillus flagellatus]
MNESWSAMKQVPQDTIQERLQSVKELSEDADGTELYEVVKDTATGEHYLHYAYLHLNVADGTKESFHHLLPLGSDDVLGVLFGEQPYAYPDHWTRPYLRNGPDGTYVWFDPSETIEGAAEENEKLAGDIASLLGEWKKRGRHDPDSVKELLERIDRTMNRDDG